MERDSCCNTTELMIMMVRQIAENTFTLPVFYLLYSYPTTTCEPLSRELRHSSDVNKCVLIDV